jgi:uncharacterized membrane protein
VVAGIPLAALGAAAYFTVFSLAILTLFGYQHVRMVLRVMVITMFAISVWLMYLQAFVIREFCQYCSSRPITTRLVVTVIALVWCAVVRQCKVLVPNQTREQGRWLSSNPRSRIFFVARSLCDRSIRTGRTHK